MTPIEDMGAVQALFDGRRLTLAREYRGQKKVELARASEVSPAAVTQWEQGKTRPTRGALAALSLSLGFEPSFFAGDRQMPNVAESTTHFRSLRSTTKRQRQQLLARLALLGELLEAVEEHVSLPPVSIPELDVGEGLRAAAEAAITVRREWEFGSGPLTNIVRAVETKGVVVARPRLATSEVDAFSRWLESRPVIVLACDKEDGARSRFDAAHELGHLVMHHDAEPGDPDLERQADAFAAEFLMPASGIGAELPERMNWPAYFRLKQRWGASLAALVRRSRDLGVISQHAYERAQVQISARGWRRNEPAPVGVEQPVVLLRALQLLNEQVGLGTPELGKRLRLREEQIHDLWQDVGLDDHVGPRVAVRL